MKSRIRIIILVCSIMLLVLCGCREQGEDTEKKDETAQTVSTQTVSTQIASTQAEESEDAMVVLNDRQKKILRDQGLPEDYSQLTASQKNAIVKIERALTYLEETYKTEFEYEGYVSGGLDGEYVTASVSGTKPKKVVTVHIFYENGKYMYRDNYEAKMAEEEYVKEVGEFLKQYFDPADFQVYVEISELNAEGDSVVERAIGVPLILVNNVYTKEELNAAAQAYAEWIAAMKNKEGGGASFKVYDNDVFKLMNVYSYRDYMGKWIYDLSVTVDSNKDIQIRWYEHDN